MKNVVIVDSVRTGLAKSHRGGFNMTRPDEMLAHIIDAILERNPNYHPKLLKTLLWGVVILRELKDIMWEEMLLYYQNYL